MWGVVFSVVGVPSPAVAGTGFASWITRNVCEFISSLHLGRSAFSACWLCWLSALALQVARLITVILRVGLVHAAGTTNNVLRRLSVIFACVPARSHASFQHFSN